MNSKRFDRTIRGSVQILLVGSRMIEHRGRRRMRRRSLRPNKSTARSATTTKITNKQALHPPIITLPAGAGGPDLAQRWRRGFCSSRDLCQSDCVARGRRERRHNRSRRCRRVFRGCRRKARPRRWSRSRHRRRGVHRRLDAEVGSRMIEHRGRRRMRRRSLRPNKSTARSATTTKITNKQALHPPIITLPAGAGGPDLAQRWRRGFCSSRDLCQSDCVARGRRERRHNRSRRCRRVFRGCRRKARPRRWSRSRHRRRGVHRRLEPSAAPRSR